MTFFDQGFAVVIGIANYLHVRKLPTAVLNDAAAFTATLKNPDYCGYPEDHVQLLVDAQATADGIRSGIGWLAERTGEKDTAVIFFSGHGGRIENGSLADNYLIAHDTDPTDPRNTAVGSEELTARLRQIKAGRLLVFFDCCHAGGIGAVKDASFAPPVFKTGLDETLYDRLGEGNGRAIIASSRSHETSLILEGMDNSLFTHYLLQALRGQAPARGDGLIRLFDVFDFVSQQVVARYHNQHPILKAELENNFPVALHQGGKKIERAPAHLAIQNVPNLPLSTSERSVLAQMFSGHERLVIKDEFGGGFGGGRVFLARPIGARGAELPTVIKTGPADVIDQEWQAFMRCIYRKVPNVAQVEGDVTYSLDGAWGGIRYPLAGDGRFYTESLRSFCRHAAVEDVVYVLEQRLFNSIGELWQDNRVEYEFHLGRSFDPLLPVNLSIDLTAAPEGAAACLITPQTVRGQTFQVGDWVELSGFTVVEVDKSKGEVALNLATPPTDALPDSYRVRITAVTNLTPYRENQPLPEPIIGVVQATRQTLLQSTIEQIFDGLDAMAPTIQLPGIGPLPNPLLKLPNILNQTQDIRVAPIHGDLNLENILVEYDHRSRNIHLIDFANARTDYALHDLLRLETGFWLYLLPEELKDLTDLPAFLHALHTSSASPPVPGLDKPFRILTAVRRRAQHLLVNPQSWDEYYQGLTVHLLGALKFKNLNNLPTAPLPKQIAFLVAAVIQQILAGPSMPSTPPSSKPSPPPPLPLDSPMTKSQLLRELRRLLRGLEIFESDDELRSVFENNEELHPWMDRLPGARARKSRVDKTVAFLQNKRHAGGHNVLILFLHILSAEFEDDTELYSQLNIFADQLESLLK